MVDAVVRRGARVFGRGDADGTAETARALPEEWPVALVYDGTTQAVMMCSPADLEDFAYGFSLSEGIISGPGAVQSLELVEHDRGTEARFWLQPGLGAAMVARRRAMAGPVGCGLCGIDSLTEAVRDLPVLEGGPVLRAAEIVAAMAALRGMQPLHDETRAVHGAAFLLPGRGLILSREDVGRHNALDKLIGALARDGIASQAGAFVMTSRLSLELVQKAALAGCRIIVAVSAPTAHAVRVGDAAGLTLIGQARGGTFDVFTHPERIVDEESGDA